MKLVHLIPNRNNEESGVGAGVEGGPGPTLFSLTPLQNRSIDPSPQVLQNRNKKKKQHTLQKKKEKPKWKDRLATEGAQKGCGSRFCVL